MAEAVYWAGRYLERAEDTARIVQVHGETHIDLPVGEDVGWTPLVEIAGTARAYDVRRPKQGSWASVYLPGWGWVDVDPTNDQVVAESYITTAWGRDYWDVSPLRGSVEGGGESHQLDVAVDVSRVIAATAGV
jgi:transglutaminase-like putative cysteine protease